MSRAHKPGPASNFSINNKRGKAAKNMEYWVKWEAGWRPETYLAVPRGVGMFHTNDPRRAEWRRSVKGK